MYRRAAMARRLRQPAAPIALLVLLSVASLAVRAAWLGEPCRAPCRSTADHLLIFDETYYVNAARVIAGITPPAGETYAGAPQGEDPNSEHPQLAKLVIAGSIELFGDGPLAWRLGSLLLGSVAILGIFALTRAAGGSDWLGLGAAALMAADNLQIVHGRVGTLDVYALAAMVWGAVLYLRRRPLLAGAVIGVGACCKLVAPYVLVALALYEVLLIRQGHGGRDALLAAGRRLAICVVSACAVFVGLLAILDRIARPYDAAAGRPLTTGAFHHLGHMLSYAAHQTSPHGPRGIASYPWEWLVDYKPIVYLNINPARASPGLQHIHPAAHFLGMMSPPVMLLALPALALACWRLGHRVRSESGDVAVLGIAWFLGTFAPFLVLSVIWERTSYLYYMVVVMPGLYLLVAGLVWRWRLRRRLVGVWMLLVLAAAILMYPFTPL